VFIYILNLLNDGLKKNNIYRLSSIEIINDAVYISKLAGLKKNFELKNFSDKVVDIFEILNKYNLTINDSFEILNKLILNDNHSWVLENIYNNLYLNKKDKFDFDLSSILKNILSKVEIGEEQMNKKGTSLMKYEGHIRGYAHIAISVGSKVKVDSLTDKIRNAGYEVASESRITGDGYYESCVLDPEGNLIEITV
jgi:hypothetical protein